MHGVWIGKASEESKRKRQWRMMENEAYMVGESEGVAARAASFSEAIELEVKCGAKTATLVFITLLRVRLSLTVHSFVTLLGLISSSTASFSYCIIMGEKYTTSHVIFENYINLFSNFKIYINFLIKIFFHKIIF